MYYLSLPNSTLVKDDLSFKRIKNLTNAIEEREAFFI